MCQRNDPATIEILWRSILTKEVLLRTESPIVNNVIKKLRNGTPLAEVDLLENDDNFESGKWIINVKETVVSTGKQVYGKGADYAFPLLFLASNLEELRHAYESLPSSRPMKTSGSIPWTLQCFVDVGVPYPSILESYVNLYDIAFREGANPDKRVQCLANIAEVLNNWVISAISNRSGRTSSSLPEFSSRSYYSKERSDSSLQLARALSTGLNSSIDAWKGSLESIVGGDMEKKKELISLFNHIEKKFQTEF